MWSLFFFFFFSSRRRHTRCGRDWSSDVCSSDLVFNPKRTAWSSGIIGAGWAGSILTLRNVWYKESWTNDFHTFDDSRQDRKSTRLNSSHVRISYAVFCLKKKKKKS